MSIDKVLPPHLPCESDENSRRHVNKYIKDERQQDLNLAAFSAGMICFLFSICEKKLVTS